MKKIDFRNKVAVTHRRTGQVRLAAAFALALVCGLAGFVAGKILAGRAGDVAATGGQAPVSTVAKDRPSPTPGQEPGPQTATPVALPPEAAIENAPPVKPHPTPVALAMEEVVTYGKSVQGRPLTAYILGHGPAVTLIFGAFHGNEPITDDMVLKLRAFLKANPRHLEGRRVVLAPVVNPDGLRRNQRANANGVDLNRNFPGTWRKEATKKRYNPGPSAASEPETRAVISLMDRYHPTKVVSIHQPFHTMNYTGQAGLELAQAMRKHNRYPITGDIGYPTPGSFGDYCGKIRDIAIVTHELPSQSASAAWQANREAWLAAIKH